MRVQPHGQVDHEERHHRNQPQAEAGTKAPFLLHATVDFAQPVLNAPGHCRATKRAIENDTVAPMHRGK